MTRDAIDEKAGASATTSSYNPTDAGADSKRPVLRTMKRESPYPLGMSRSDLNRRGRSSLTKTSEFAFAQIPREGPPNPEEDPLTTTTTYDDHGSTKELEAPSADSGMSSNQEVPEPNSTQHVQHPRMNATIQSVQSFTTIADEGPLNLPEHGPDTDNYFNFFTRDSTEEDPGELQTPNNGSPDSPHSPHSVDEAPDDDSTSMDSDGYPLASAAFNLSYRRRPSLGVGPQEESNVFR
ncbi:hypothetical protein R1sor_017767 [Riccia sorocarpa]|uniref:Uncharacterized protein n=1 Tax=Riccia sorocarpa TaxID=122646 RepID=A0ABD3IBD0_9MARC